MNKSLRLTTLAAAVALAMGSGAVFAAAPAATQLPGQGAVDPHSPTATVGVGTITAGSQTITLSGDTVINWGKATGATAINPNQPAGFNVGAAADLSFTGTGAVLNVDVSGNASQIFGKLGSNAGNLFVANTNGVIVGAGASISGSAEVGLIGNTLLNADGTSPYSAASFTGAAPNYAGAGGDVTVQPGGGITAPTILVSGGGAVNVDLGALTGAVSLQAGVPNSTNALVTPNTGASLMVSTVAGDLPGALAQFASAGAASNNGVLDMTGVTFGDPATTAGDSDVAGTFTNNAELTAAAFTISGNLVNNGQFNGTGAVNVGALTNAGAFNLNIPATQFQDMINTATFAIVAHGGLTNTGELTNQSMLNTYDGSTLAYPGSINVIGGDLDNSGTLMTVGLNTNNGSINNSGQLTATLITTTSDGNTANGYVKGADYSITNSGVLSDVLPDGHSMAPIDIQALELESYNVPFNGATGSFINTGTMNLANGEFLQITAMNDLTLGGTIQVQKSPSGTTFAPISATNPIAGMLISAGGLLIDNSRYVLQTDGVLTIGTDVVSSGTVNGNSLIGSQVAVMSNVSSVDSSGTPSGKIAIFAGPQQPTAADGTPAYAVRVAAGKTVTAGQIAVGGMNASYAPNVILQGTLAANAITLGSNGFGTAVSDVFTGSAGGLEMWGNGTGNATADALLQINATGRVKTAPYLNDTNFRYNYLPVDMVDDSTLNLALSAAAQQGTPTSGYNLMVNGNVNVGSVATGLPAPINGTGSAVTGVNVVPNSHLVLQSTGSIATTSTTVDGTTTDFAPGAFYWPGYVYLGNINTDVAGNALPGTLGLGNISLGGDFSNVLPGDVAGASGIHFITQLPLVVATGARITTNANAWFNFGTDVLTQAYSTGTLLPNVFFGGAQGPGTVVNYAAMPAANFVTQPPVSDK